MTTLSASQRRVLESLTKCRGFSTEPFERSAHALFRKGFVKRKYETLDGGFWKFAITSEGIKAVHLEREKDLDEVS